MFGAAGAAERSEGEEEEGLGAPAWLQAAALPAPAPAALRAGALLQALLVALEAAGGRRALRLIGRFGEQLTERLTAALFVLSAPSVAAAPLHGSGGQQARALAAWALRCLESIAARPTSFALPPAAVAAMMTATGAIAGRATAGRGATAALLEVAGPQAGGPAFAAACSLLAALLRHRAEALTRCMAPLIVAQRRLLLLLLRWDVDVASGGGAGRRRAGGAAASSALVAAAAALSRIYEAAGEQAAAAPGPYCLHLLGDYVVHAAAPRQPAAYTAALLAALADGGDDGSGAAVAAGGAVAPALRRGAYCLIAALTPAQLQHLHGALGGSSSSGGGSGSGGARRAALAELKRDYEKHHKYSGKI